MISSKLIFTLPFSLFSLFYFFLLNTFTSFNQRETTGAAVLQLLFHLYAKQFDEIAAGPLTDEPIQSLPLSPQKPSTKNCETVLHSRGH